MYFRNILGIAFLLFIGNSQAKLLRADLIVAPTAEVIGAFDSETSLVRVTLEGSTDLGEEMVGAFSFSIRTKFDFSSLNLDQLKETGGIAIPVANAATEAWSDFDISVFAFAVQEGDFFGSFLQVYGSSTQNVTVNGSGVIAKIEFKIANANLTEALDTGDFIPNDRRHVEVPNPFTLPIDTPFGFFSYPVSPDTEMVPLNVDFQSTSLASVPEPNSTALLGVGGLIAIVQRAINSLSRKRFFHDLVKLFG